MSEEKKPPPTILGAAVPRTEVEYDFGPMTEKTLGEVYWGGSGGVLAYAHLGPQYRKQIEAGAAAVGAAAIARLADALTPTADDSGHAAEFLRYRDALQRLADEDTPVLDSGLGGGAQEELHVRTQLARQALGLDVGCCTECIVSLGLEPEEL